MFVNKGNGICIQIGVPEYRNGESRDGMGSQSNPE